MGKIVVCNVSRSIINAAAQCYPVHVASIVADINLRARRLSGRGRETEEDIKQRLERPAIPLSAQIPTAEVTNNGTLAQGQSKMVRLLEDLAVQIR